MKYATIIGYAPHHIPIYYNSPYFDTRRIRHYGPNGIYYGIKYQCVELVRRWYIEVLHLTFPYIDDASKMFDLKFATDLTTHKKIPFIHILNNGRAIPQEGDIILWKKEGIYADTGHTAIMIKVVHNTTILVAEQNGDTANGLRRINCHHNTILGWMRV